MNKSESKSSDDKFTDAVGRQLDDQSEKLDAAIVAGLDQARRKALENMPDHPDDRNNPWFIFGWYQWLGAGAMTAVAIVLTLWLTVETVRQDELLQHETLEILAAEEPIEFYDDLSFYQWLAKQKNAGKNAG